MLVDSSTDGIRHHGYLRSHWHQERAKPSLDLVFVQPTPLHIGENDVDTVLHLLLAHHAGPSVFEGMCNPPGGDWSGVSLQPASRATELRWLTLPRVSDAGAKRPDHVFQFFRRDGQPIILSVESKETAASVEPRIGPRLTAYIRDLLRTPASVERATQDTVWSHSDSILDDTQFLMVSAVAFKSDSSERTADVKRRAEADLLMAFAFANGGQSCVVQLIPTSTQGEEVANMIASIPLQWTHIRIVK
jgi:hypothetical protein